MEVLGNFGGIDTPLMTSKLKENELNSAIGSIIIPIGLGISSEKPWWNTYYTVASKPKETKLNGDNDSPITLYTGLNGYIGYRLN